MANAELRQDGIDRANLQTGPTTAISQFRGSDMILPVRRQQRQRREPIDDVFPRSRTGEALQQFLQDQPRSQDRCATFEGIAQRLYFWSQRSLVAPEGKRPYAGIDEQTHRRERSAL